MKINPSLLIKLSACALLAIASCKQDSLVGPKSTQSVKVYLPYAEAPKKVFNLLSTGVIPVVDSTVKTAPTVNFNIPVYRGGQGSVTDKIVVDVAVDNSTLTALKDSLPVGTIPLDPADFTIQAKDTLANLGNLGTNYELVKAQIISKINVAKLNLAKYASKTVAFGVKISNSTGSPINDAESLAVVYFDVNTVLDIITPKVNLLDPTKWTIATKTAGVTIVQTANGFTYTGTAGAGSAEIYYPINIRGGKHYTINMNGVAANMLNSWFEVYVGLASPLPVSGADYVDGNVASGNQKRLALSGYATQGKSPVSGALVTLGSSANNNVISYPTDCTVYIVARAGINGGGTLGPNGVVITNIDFRRID